MAKGNGSRDVVIEVRDVVVGFGDHIVLDHVDLDVYRGESSALSAAPAPASRC